MPESADSFTVEDQLCFALYDASRAMTARYRERLGDLGLTYTQYVVMLVLWSDPVVTVSNLGERLNLDSGTLSPLLKRLESRGLVDRRRSSSDERVVEVHLTTAGAGLRQPSFDVQCIVEDATGLDPDEVSRLNRELRVLVQRLRSASA